MHSSEYCISRFHARHAALLSAVATQARQVGIVCSTNYHRVPFNDGDRPCDLILHNGPGDVAVGVDVAVVTSLQRYESRMHTYFRDPKYEVNTSENTKINHYRANCEQAGIRFEPCVISTHGILGAGATNIINIIITRRMDVLGDSQSAARAHVLTYILSRVYSTMARNIEQGIEHSGAPSYR